MLHAAVGFGPHRRTSAMLTIVWKLPYDDNGYQIPPMALCEGREPADYYSTPPKKLSYTLQLNTATIHVGIEPCSEKCHHTPYYDTHLVIYIAYTDDSAHLHVHSAHIQHA